MNIDIEYINLIKEVMEKGDNITTRNSKVKRLFGKTITIDSTPLISIRKTAFKTALKEMEFFLEGRSHLDYLAPAVHPWWEPFCTVTPKTLHYSYGSSFRSIFNPTKNCVIEVETRKAGGEDLTKPTVVNEKEGTADSLTNTVLKSNKDLDFVVLNCIGKRRTNKIYNIKFIVTGYVTSCRKDVIILGAVKDCFNKSTCGIGFFGEPNKKHPRYRQAQNLWQHMIRRCYDSNDINYHRYGGRGVSVCNRWLCFASFLNDLSKLPGYEKWSENTAEFGLDKDYYNSKVYGPKCCVFLPKNLNTNLSKSKGKYSLYKNNNLVKEFLCKREVAEFLSVSGCVVDNNLGRLNKKGYTLSFTANKENTKFRYKLLIDQLEDFTNGIKDHPFSRRNIITTWIPEHVNSGLMNPTNCHGTIIQAFVDNDKKLNLVMYQRSADIIVGLPANLIQYSAFHQWLAARTNTTVGQFVWMGGDVHLYSEHYDLAERMIDRVGKCRETPRLVYHDRDKEFKAKNFELVGEYLPVITEKAKMVV